MKMIRSSSLILILTFASSCCRSEKSAAKTTSSVENSRGVVQNLSKEKSGPSQELKSELLGDESKNTLPRTRKGTSLRRQRTYDYSSGPQHIIIKPGKIKPGEYADKLKRKTKNWKLPESVKTSPSDSKFSWSFWEADDSEFWPDDADDSQPPVEETTTTTTTAPTSAPSPPPTKGENAPVSIHKHYHYFKKAELWPIPDPMTMPMPMPPDEMMPMMPDEMMKEMMKGMMMPGEMPPTDSDKKGFTGIIKKLSAVDPITILVAGIIPASLILAAAIPSVMNKMMNGNKGDTTMMPPIMPPMMVSTTAMGGSDMMMGGREHHHHHRDSTSMAEILQAASQFGLQALKEPQCARKKFCRFAKEKLLSETPAFQRALRIAAVAMRDSWLDSLGVRDILQSLSLGTCDEAGCNELTEMENGTTQPTPA